MKEIIFNWATSEIGITFITGVIIWIIAKIFGKSWVSKYGWIVSKVFFIVEKITTEGSKTDFFIEELKSEWTKEYGKNPKPKDISNALKHVEGIVLMLKK